MLSDIEMPDMDGFALTKHIRDDPRFADIPVILHSSLTGISMSSVTTSGFHDAIFCKASSPLRAVSTSPICVSPASMPHKAFRMKDESSTTRTRIEPAPIAYPALAL